MEQFAIKDTAMAFIGLGLIGGSLARGIKRARPDIRIMAYMRTRSKLEQAKKDGIVDVILDGIGEELRECDIIFLCTPVEYNAQYLSAIRPYLKPGALITDVGSTKTDIHEEILRQGLSHCFVGGHPMAGSEKTGYEHSYGSSFGKCLLYCDAAGRRGRVLCILFRECLPSAGSGSGCGSNPSGAGLQGA